VKIAESVEGTIADHGLIQNIPDIELEKVDESVAVSVVKTADEVCAKYIVCLTRSGNIVRLISRFKPNQQILAFTPNEVTFRQILLSFGAYPVLVDKFEHLSDAVRVIKQFLNDGKLVEVGDKIVIASTSPFGKGINTNMMLVETI
jgi:pyruvate kinase